MKLKLLSAFCASALILGFSATAEIYSGNENSGFGRAIGGGSLTLTGNPLSISEALTNTPPALSNALVPDFDSSLENHTYRFGFDWSDVGLGLGSRFAFSSTYISNTANNSEEAIAGNDTPAQAWNPFLQTTFGSYT